MNTPVEIRQRAEQILVEILERAGETGARLSSDDLRDGALCTRIIELSNKLGSVHPLRRVSDEEIERRLYKAWESLQRSADLRERS